MSIGHPRTRTKPVL